MFPELFPRTDTFTLMLWREASNKGLYLNWAILHLDSHALIYSGGRECLYLVGYQKWHQSPSGYHNGSLIVTTVLKNDIPDSTIEIAILKI
jgi:hypothetical protein